jgi:CRISPR-associated endonuclease/helicase Cas3
MESCRFWNYWGKAKPTEHGLDFHRLVFHSLDVAAVGATYLEQAPALLDTCCARLHCSRSAFLSWTGFFLVLHDLGKFSDAFQSLRPDIVCALQHRDAPGASYTERHDTLGFWMWNELADDGLLDDIGLLGARRDLNCWMRAVCGHHGMPPIDNGPADRHFRRADQDAVADFVRAMAALLLNDEARRMAESAGAEFDVASEELSWWFAGLTVLADWLGSNTGFFPYQTTWRDFGAYWEEARVAARRALAVAGVQSAMIAPGKSLGDFFPYIRQASPLQAWANDVVLARDPQIFLLEDVTGAGKTEAAMLLAYRLMEQGAAQGFFIGLPTMATANAMYGRIADVYQELFADDASLALGHGFKDLVTRFAASVLPEGVSELDPAQRDDTASACCTAWLVDHNKRVLLAPAGVGTVDQVLLAVLHSKHQSLRLLGLFNKILIIDEVHACDAYMEGVLKVLLRFHASMGGSAILLSATLPNRMKTGLLNAYASGRHCAPPRQTLAGAYPLATHWSDSDGVLHQDALASRPNVSRMVQLRYVSDEEQLLADVVAALRQNQCVGWICNTVADALAVYERVSRHVEPARVILFHARFALGDRLRTEERVLEHFGCDSGPAERSGRLMIATQVAEQSLDVDFDVLVSDMAPIDRLLQRAGRAQRHVRDRHGNRLLEQDATDGRHPPGMWVLAPPWTETPQSDWYGAKFRSAQYVYERHDQLWLTAKALRDGKFRMPDDARRLIEMVYSGEEEVPAALQDGANRAEGKVWAQASQAQMNALRFEGGYRRGEIGDWWADTKTPSRLGEETREVMLAKWVDGKLLPWQDGPWPYSMVKVAARLIARAELGADAALRPAYEQLLLTLPMQGRYCVLLPLELQGDGSWQARAWTQEDVSRKRPAKLHTWLYDADLGLRMKEADTAEAASD